MTELTFVDTNVLVYAVDASEPKKQPSAMEWMSYLWRSRVGRLSYQVLQEYYVTVTQKLTPGIDAPVARSNVRSLLAWQPLTIDAAVLEAAWMVQERHRLSWWDAIIVAAAQIAGCRTLLTEDLQEGRDFEGVCVVNPFRKSPPGAGK